MASDSAGLHVAARQKVVGHFALYVLDHILVHLRVTQQLPVLGHHDLVLSDPDIAPGRHADVRGPALQLLHPVCQLDLRGPRSCCARGG